MFKFNCFYRLFCAHSVASCSQSPVPETIMRDSHCTFHSLFNFVVLHSSSAAQNQWQREIRVRCRALNTQMYGWKRTNEQRKKKRNNRNNGAAKKMCQAHKVNNLIHFDSRARARLCTREIIALKLRCYFRFRNFEKRNCFFFSARVRRDRRLGSNAHSFSAVAAMMMNELVRKLIKLHAWCMRSNPPSAIILQLALWIVQRATLTAPRRHCR